MAIVETPRTGSAQAEVDPGAAPPGSVRVRRLGSVRYAEAWRQQRSWVAARGSREIPDTLFLLGHPPVVTLGRAGDRRHLLASERALASRGVDFVETDRGGDITFHGPGQIIGYAVVDLRSRGRDLHAFLRDLEEVLIQTLDRFDIDAVRVPGLTGVWVSGSKVAAIGVRVSRWITHHGFALNVDTDLSYFDLIVPCGLSGRPVTSMAALIGGPVDRCEVEDALEAAFLGVFGMRGGDDGDN